MVHTYFYHHFYQSWWKFTLTWWYCRFFRFYSEFVQGYYWCTTTELMLFPYLYTYIDMTWSKKQAPVRRKKDFFFVLFPISENQFSFLNKEKKAKSLYPFTTYISFVIFNGVEYILLYFTCFTYGICTRIHQTDTVYISKFLNKWMPISNATVELMSVRNKAFIFVYYWDIDEKEDLCQIEQKMEQ